MDLSIAPLVAADELLVHQVADTFGSVGPTDLDFTERLWVHACGADGGPQVVFGLGRYPNRGVLDAFGGVSRGTEQWTVRASRALSTDPVGPAVGPLRYGVEEPLRTVSIALDANEHAPIAFELTLAGVAPPRTEPREILRAPYGGRVVNDVVRYHQAATVSGWIECDGARVEVRDGFGARDHSWGVRARVGEPRRDLPIGRYPSELRSFTSWASWALARADGSRYGLFHYALEANLPGLPARRFAAAAEHPDGTDEPFADARFELRFDDANRRLLGGTITFLDGAGAPRPVTVTPEVSGTGFHLGAGLYFGLDGWHHGMWRGELHVEGAHDTGCDDPAVARRLHQHRDCLVRIDDPAGGGTGWGSIQTIAIGAFPELGLTAASTFV